MFFLPFPSSIFTLSFFAGSMDTSASKKRKRSSRHTATGELDPKRRATSKPRPADPRLELEKKAEDDEVTIVSVTTAKQVADRESANANICSICYTRVALTPCDACNNTTCQVCHDQMVDCPFCRALWEESGEAQSRVPHSVTTHEMFEAFFGVAASVAPAPAPVSSVAPAPAPIPSVVPAPAPIPPVAPAPIPPVAPAPAPIPPVVPAPAPISFASFASRPAAPRRTSIERERQRVDDRMREFSAQMQAMDDRFTSRAAAPRPERAASSRNGAQVSNELRAAQERVRHQAAEIQALRAELRNRGGDRICYCSMLEQGSEQCGDCLQLARHGERLRQMF